MIKISKITMKKNLKKMIAWGKSCLRAVLRRAMLIQEDMVERNRMNVPLLIRRRLYQENITDSAVRKVAIFFDLEALGTSAIAGFSVRTFCVDSERFHVFTKLPDTKLASEVLRKIEQEYGVPAEAIRVFDADSYGEMDEIFHYAANIFVLGNSSYNLKTFNYAIKMYRDRERNWLYFHDGVYANLLYMWALLGSYSWEKLIEDFYGNVSLHTVSQPEDLVNISIYMIKPVVALTGCSRILVNTDNCTPIIEQELGLEKVEVRTTFLPVPDYRHVVAERSIDTRTLLIAHFGILSELKQIVKLIKAVEALQKKQPAKLMLAGYGAARYVKSLPAALRQHLIVVESPSSERMLALMKGADITVQLRWPLLGQASGVVSEMIGLGLKCITTQGFVPAFFQQCVVEVQHDITPEALAETLLTQRGNMAIPIKEYEAILQRFSCKASANLVFGTVTGSRVVIDSYP